MSKAVRLLYIEDDGVDARAFLRMIRQRGLPWTVKLAGSLAAARACLADSTFDVIVADNHLPDGESPELFPEIPDVPFVLITGTLEEQLALRTLERGADDYLVKDVEHRYLDALPFAVEKTLYRKAIHEKERRLTRELAESKRAAEQARKTAEEASQAKDRFLAVLSHELRTPLTPVVTGLALLRHDPSLSKRARAQVEILRRNVELESRLIDDLLDLTRIARGRVQLEKRPVDLATVLERAVDVCRPDIEARRLHFGVDAGQERYILDADAGRLQQVFWNLLKNSIKFTPQGGCVGVRCRGDDGQVVIEVNDSGVGIEPDAIGHIFDAFAQEAGADARRFGGLGLGLAISKAFVEMHGGTIAARSAGRDRGTTVSISLPVLRVEREPAGTQSRPAVVRGESALPPLRILLVEDHGDTAEMLTLLLERDGHEVATAGDVATALEATSSSKFDVLLSDLGLPDRSGLDLVRDLRARGDRVPAIALSGYGQERDVEQSREAGFDAHLVKPVDPARLRDVIGGLMGLRQRGIA